MHTLSALLFSLCANLDNLPIGIAYGLKKIQIPLHYNVFISALIGLGTFVFMKLGDVILTFLSYDVAAKLACSALILIGLGFLYQALTTNQKEQAIAVCPMNLKQCLSLSLTLMINNATVGISAQLAGAPASLTALFTFFASIFFLFLGQWISHHCFRLYSNKAIGVLSGIILILLGIWEMLI